jgi:hypothetical protein
MRLTQKLDSSTRSVSPFPDLTQFHYLAIPTCYKCIGLGWFLGHLGRRHLCHCVRRAVFRQVLNMIKYIRGSDKVTQVDYKYIGYRSIGANSNSKSYIVYGILNLEFCIDFELLARRCLTKRKLRIFKLHYLQKKDYKICCRSLCMSRGNFFHDCYRIERILGFAALTLRPYPLFPISDYFDQRLHRVLSQ